MDNLQKWREERNRGEEHTLPSGLEVKLRRLDLVDMVAQGHIPDTLTGLVDQAAGSVEFKVSQIKEILPLLDAVALACVVEPEIVEGHGDDDHLGVAELTAQDKFDIFAWANSGAEPLQKFRPEQAADVGAAQPGSSVRKASKRNRRNNG